MNIISYNKKVKFEYLYFFKKIFFEILNENAIENICTIVAIIAAKIRSFPRCHAMKNEEIEGMVVKIAIIVPLTKMSSEPFLNVFINCFQ